MKLPSEPMDFAAAGAASHAASELQHQAENFYARKCREYALAERAYREALALAIIRIKATGEAVTAARDLARGDKHVAELGYKRDLAEGLRDAARESLWRHTAGRRELEQLIDWSKRASFLDTTSHSTDPAIGGKRAA